MTAEEIHKNLQARFGDAIVEAKLDAPQPFLVLDPKRMKEVCLFLRDEDSLQFDFCSCVSGVDYKEGKLGAVYHLASMVHKHKIVLKAFCTVENPHIQSVASVWGGADWHEREAYDLLGIIFDEHPDLRRILLPYDWEGYPLRKDYKVPEFYNGMKVPY
ncbi:MAG: NADH-quinone oxidoreductase subunit C [Bacteroidota bacterium]